LEFHDRDRFLFVTGRVKEVLVLGGGKKIIPDDLERSYGGASEIAEIAVLEDKGALVALVRPEPAKLRDRGVTNCATVCASSSGKGRGISRPSNVCPGSP
jgi:long-chain acyl-CoA synthetase